MTLRAVHSRAGSGDVRRQQAGGDKTQRPDTGHKKRQGEVGVFVGRGDFMRPDQAGETQRDESVDNAFLGGGLLRCQHLRHALLDYLSPSPSTSAIE